MRPAAYVAAALSALVLVGCDGGAEPSAPPTSEPALTTATATPEAAAETSEADATTAEPTEAGPPEMPDEAREQTEAGAEAFALHYIDTFNYAYAEGDGDVLASISGDTCVSCEALAGLVAKPSPIDEYLAVEDFSATLTGDSARVVMDLEQSATPDSPRQAGTAVIQLTGLDEGWEVGEITIQPDA